MIGVPVNALTAVRLHTVSARSIRVSRAEQLEKAFELMDVTAGKSSCVISGHERKALELMDVMTGRFTLVSLGLFAKEFNPIFVSFGRSIVVRVLQF